MIDGTLGNQRVGGSLASYPKSLPSIRLLPVRLGLKVDVDTLGGLTEGVPALLKVFAARDIRASFFVALGPDNSGRAIFRVFRQRGFLEKMLRTRAPSVYGFPTMLYGTVLPAPSIGRAASRPVAPPDGRRPRSGPPWL